MNPLVFIQADVGGEPYSTNGAAAERGFRYLGYETRRVPREELDTLPLAPENIVVGGMGCLHAVWERLGVRVPVHLSAPAVLAPFLGRESWRTTQAELLQANRFPIFVKPYEDSKVFNGQVVRGVEELALLLEPRPGFPTVGEDLPLLAQDPVNFVSEWRVFVLRGRAVGIAHYRGDLLAFPSGGVIRAALGAYTHAPAGYSADFGITDTGRTLLVETNDGYALGYMGLAEARYAELLRARWDEITGA
ncbi:MAG: ATP-grasp domain-containing protein [Fibrella sp.]|nr:ATP-grasp domain-containing protein [Armatimonadota bacterium]